MSHIFISYSKKNQTYARAVADHLLAHGFDVWIDDRIDYGDEWWDVIVRTIRECAACVVILSPESKNSKWVKREVGLADQLDKPIFPLLLNGENWELFVWTQYVDVRDGSLPPPDFCDRLAEIVPRREEHGTDVTAIPESEEPPQATQTDPEQQALLSKESSIQEVTPASIEKLILSHETVYALPDQSRAVRINVLRFTPDGKFLVAGLNQDKIAIWNTDTGTLKTIIAPKKSEHRARLGTNWPTRSIALSPGTRLLASTTYEPEIQLWMLSDLEPYRVIETVNHAPISVAFSPDGKWLIAGLDENGHIYSWSLTDDFRRVDYVKAHNGRVEAVTFHPKKLNFISCSVDGTVKLWEIVEEEIREVRFYEGHDREHVVTVAISPDGLLVVSGSVTGQIYLWETETGRTVHELKHDQVVRTLAFSPDSRLVASGSNDRTLRIWDTTNGRSLVSKKFDSAVRAVDFSPDGRILAATTEGGSKVQIWKVESI